MAEPVFDRIAVIGLGLIGSSIARAARTKHLAGTIIGCDANEISLAYARKQNFIDTAMRDPALAVAHCDLVILATPPSTLADIAKAIAPALQPGCIVMDTCSVKQVAIAAIAPHLPEGIEFIPAHPIAGSEQSGVGAGRADLFEKKRIIVTPETPAHSPLQAITAFWQGMGARVEAMPPHLHDMLYAYVSHLPQFLAFASAPVAPDADEKFLRLSHSNIAMWAEIFLLNKENMIKALDRYLDVISHIDSELKNAPEEPSGQDDAEVRTLLFPRIAASCLITTAMEAEKQAGFTFVRYAGTGFADFTSPAAAPPDADIERISGQHKAVAAVLREYMERLKKFRKALDGNVRAMEKTLTQ